MTAGNAVHIPADATLHTAWGPGDADWSRVRVAHPDVDLSLCFTDDATLFRFADALALMASRRADAHRSANPQCPACQQGVLPGQIDRPEPVRHNHRLDDHPSRADLRVVQP